MQFYGLPNAVSVDVSKVKAYFTAHSLILFHMSEVSEVFVCLYIDYAPPLVFFLFSPTAS
jgi:hypothetical protein